MNRKDFFKNSYVVERDALTGRNVTCLTSEGTLNHHPYFYNKVFTNDDENLIYISDCGGDRNIYLLNIRDAVSRQLTNRSDIADFSPYLSADDSYLLFSTKTGSILKLDLNDLSEEILYQSDAGWQLSELFGISGGGDYLLLDEMLKDDVIKSDGTWSSFKPQWEKKPHCRLIMLNTKTKKWHVVHENPNCWIGHPQIRPTNNKQLMFCHEGPGECIDARIWFVNTDGTNLRCATPKLPNELVTTHEYWLRDGSKVAFMYKANGEPVKIKFLDPETLEQEDLMECSGFCHFMSNMDNSVIIGDGTNKNELYLYIVDVKSRKEEKLCLHGSSFKTYGHSQDSHPHPAISNTGKYVAFTSDKQGSPNVYLCEI